MRTVRYYDKLGLLHASGRSESGQRLYTELDFVRLGQILTLKLIGLSLDEIKSLLTSDMGAIQDLLARQKTVLSQQVSQLVTVIQTIERAQVAISESHALDLEQFIDIIKAVNMNTQSEWLSQFVTDAQQNRLTEIGLGDTLDRQKHSGEAWRQLFIDIQAHLDGGINAPTEPELVTRWDALMGKLAGDDPDMAAGLTDAYANIDRLPDMNILPDDTAGWIQGLGHAARFIQRARGKS